MFLHATFECVGGPCCLHLHPKDLDLNILIPYGAGWLSKVSGYVLDKVQSPARTGNFLLATGSRRAEGSTKSYTE